MPTMNATVPPLTPGTISAAPISRPWAACVRLLRRLYLRRRPISESRQASGLYVAPHIRASAPEFLSHVRIHLERHPECMQAFFRSLQHKQYACLQKIPVGVGIQGPAPFCRRSSPLQDGSFPGRFRPNPARRPCCRGGRLRSVCRFAALPQYFLRYTGNPLWRARIPQCRASASAPGRIVSALRRIVRARPGQHAMPYQASGCVLSS